MKGRPAVDPGRPAVCRPRVPLQQCEQCARGTNTDPLAVVIDCSGCRVRAHNGCPMFVDRRGVGLTS